MFQHLGSSMHGKIVSPNGGLMRYSLAGAMCRVFRFLSGLVGAGGMLGREIGHATNASDKEAPCCEV